MVSKTNDGDVRLQMATLFMMPRGTIISATFRCGSTYYATVSSTNKKYALLTAAVSHLDKVGLHKREPLFNNALNVAATLVHITYNCYQFGQQSATQRLLDTQDAKIRCGSSILRLERHTSASSSQKILHMISHNVLAYIFFKP